MTSIPFDIIGFDLDGTLVDSSGDIGAAVNHALASVGLPPENEATIKRFVGKGSRAFFEPVLKAAGAWSDDTMAVVMPAFQRYYAENLSTFTRPYPGALAAIETLRTQGKRTALCTNKPERFALPLLHALDLNRWFDAVICGDTLGPGTLKPNPAPIHAMVDRAGGGRSVFLGDTSHDIEAARAAGLASIAVRFGFVDRADSLGADATLAHYDALVPLLSRWPD